MKRILIKTVFALILYTYAWGEESLRSTVIVGYLLGEVTVQQVVYSLISDDIVISESQSQLKTSPNGYAEEVLLSLRSSQPGYPDSVLLRFFLSEGALVAALITGKVDYAILENDQSVAEVVHAVPEIKVPWSYLPEYTVMMMCYNCSNPMFDNRSVRSALTLAINKKGIISKLLADNADFVEGPLDRKSSFHPSGMKPYNYNPQQALKLLVMQGWGDTDGDNILDKNGDPFEFSLIFPRGIILNENVVRWIKINLNEIGIDVHPLPLNRKQINQRLSNRDFDAVLFQHQFLEGMESLEDFFSTNSNRSFIGWKSSSLNQYVSIYRSVTNPERRRLMFQAAQKLINREQPVTFLYSKWIRFHLINSAKFSGFLDTNNRVKPIWDWHLIGLEEQ